MMNNNTETYADYIFEGTAEAGRMVMMNHVNVCRNQPEKTATMKRVIQKMVDCGLQNIIENSGLIRVFLYDLADNRNNAALQESDGICFWAEDSTNAAVCRCIIGISVDAFQWGEDYITLVFLHELTHGLLRFGENHHNAVFHNQLDHFIMLYNERCGGDLSNDYASLPPEQQKDVAYYKYFRGDCSRR